MRIALSGKGCQTWLNRPALMREDPRCRRILGFISKRVACRLLPKLQNVRFHVTQGAILASIQM